jgi:hypothetical protein
MGKIVMEEYEEMPVLPDSSIVFLKVDSQNVKEVSGQRGTWEKLEFTFKLMGIQVLGDDGDLGQYDPLIGAKIYGSVPYRFTDSPENKLKQWVEALLGMELTPGFELDTDLLVKREARGITTLYDKRAINQRTGHPFKGHQIESLLAKNGAILGRAGADSPWSTSPSTSNLTPSPFSGELELVAPAARVPQAMATLLDDEPPF